MTVLLQLAALWSVLSVFVAVGCSLLFQGADAYAEKAARRPVEPEDPAHVAA